GAGIMIQVPDAFYRQVAGVDLPPPGQYVTGLVFLPREPDAAAVGLRVLDKYVAAEGARILGWREVPVDPTGLGAAARAARPRIRQVFLSATDPGGRPLSGLELERVAWCVRKQAERESRERGTPVYLPSLSGRTMVYKGMLTPAQLTTFYPDLTDPLLASAIAVVHSRFSTNTFPSWSLAHPYRLIAHNGEFNTIRGNRNWMAAREAMLASPLLPGKPRRVLPVCSPGGADSAHLHEVLELLCLARRSLPPPVPRARRPAGGDALVP